MLGRLPTLLCVCLICVFCFVIVLSCHITQIYNMRQVLVESYVGTSANIVAEEKQTLLPTAKSSHRQVANLVSFLDKVGQVLVLEKYILQNQRNTFYRIK